MFTSVMLFVSHGSEPARMLALPLLYVSPDQLLPITSLFGALAGLAMMFWNRVVSAASRVKTLFTRSANRDEANTRA